MKKTLPSKSWPALAGRQSGSLRLEQNRAVFSYDDPMLAQFELPYLGLMISVAGENSHHYFLFHPSKLEQEICVQTSEPIEALAQFGLRAAADTLSQSSLRKKSRFARLTMVTIVLFFLLFGVPWVISLLPATLINSMVSQEQETSIGNLIFPMVAAKTIEDHVLQTSLEKIAKKITSSSPEIQELDLKLHVSRDRESNAFALPGQTIVINEGLLKGSKTWQEVAGVLAHEIGHIEQRHSLRALTGSAGVLLGMGFLAIITGADFAGWLASGSNLISLQYSREDEFSADSRGSYFLEQAGIGSEGLILFLENGLKKNPERNRWLERFKFMSTHPLLEERIQRLRAFSRKAPDSDPFKTLDLHSIDFQDKP
ncbi:MAG: M48 family metallopeptidase [Bdellovibrionales bacterium]|nr:M48 family metallopeptidase [Bdellovibrionales bacterium]